VLHGAVATALADAQGRVFSRMANVSFKEATS
jgi:hypothetical protein